LVTDGIDSVAGSASLDITPINGPPTTSPVTLVAIAEDSGPRLITQAELLANATDVGGASLTATGLAISAGSGSLVDNGDGTWTYAPALNNDTEVSFSYTVTDGADSVAGSATLDITPVNDPPLGGEDLLQVLTDQEIVFSEELLTANDVDIDSSSVAVTSVSFPNFGTIVDRGGGNYLYRPAPGFVGTDSFSYQVTDAEGATDTVTVVVVVSGSGADNPSAVGDGTSGGPGGAVAGQDAVAAQDPSSGNADATREPTEQAPTSGSTSSPTGMLGELPGVVVPAEYVVVGHTLPAGPASSDVPPPGTVRQIVPPKALFDAVGNLRGLLGFGPGASLHGASFYRALSGALDDLRQQLSPDQQNPTHRVLVQVATGSTVALSVGFVSWLLRSGALAAALASSLPSWSRFDPIPVLVARRRKARQAANRADRPEQMSEAAENLFRDRAAARAAVSGR
jgi:hypothetical protein